MDYTKEQIINLLNKASDKGFVNINGSVSDIFDDSPDLSELELNEDMFKLSHEVFKGLSYYIDLKSVFNVTTLNELTQSIISISEEFHTNEDIIEMYTTGGEDEEESIKNKIKGDLFEIFAEIFFKLTSSDDRVGVTDYTSVRGSDDYGVDGYGIGQNGKPCTIQVKFRSNPTKKLTIKDLKNFQGLSYCKYNVDPTDDNNLIVFSNSDDVHWSTETRVMESRIKNLCRNQVSRLVNNNTSFWKNLSKVIDHNIK